MAEKNLVMFDGQLAEKIEVVSHQVIELGSLETEVNANQTTYDNVVRELVEADADPEVLVEIALRRNEAKAALEDSKSNLERGQKLVEEFANASQSEGVDIPVAVAEAQPGSEL